VMYFNVWIEEFLVNNWEPDVVPFGWNTPRRAFESRISSARHILGFWIF